MAFDQSTRKVLQLKVREELVEPGSKTASRVEMVDSKLEAMSRRLEPFDQPVQCLRFPDPAPLPVVPD